VASAREIPNRATDATAGSAADTGRARSGAMAARIGTPVTVKSVRLRRSTSFLDGKAPQARRTWTSRDAVGPLRVASRHSQSVSPLTRHAGSGPSHIGGEDRGEPTGLVHVSSPATKRQPERYSSRCSGLE
jgi:hypothetical protein